MTIYDKLHTIQNEIKVPKDLNNAFAGFKYRNAETILAKLKPLLLEHKLILLLTDDIREYGFGLYIEATARLTNIEAPDEIIEVKALAREEHSRPKMSEGQLTGSASSYARKYALNGLLLLDDNSDPDSHDNSNKLQTVKPIIKPIIKPVDTLTIAKDNLNKELKNQGYDNLVKMKLIFTKVLNKSTIDSEKDANEVLQALEEGLV